MPTSTRTTLAWLLWGTAFLTRYATAIVSSLLYLTGELDISTAPVTTKDAGPGLLAGAIAVGLCAIALLTAGARTYPGPRHEPAGTSTLERTLAAFSIPMSTLLLTYLLLRPWTDNHTNEHASETLGHGLLTALDAGITEETVLVATPLALAAWTTRPDRRRLTALAVLLVALRLSFHLYYGTEAVQFLPWAAVSLWVYWRWGSLLPMIAAHTLYDALSTITPYWAPLTAHTEATYAAVYLTPLALTALLAARRTRQQHGTPTPHTRP